MLHSNIGSYPMLWTTAYAALAVPPSLRGHARRYVAFDGGAPTTIVCVGRAERFERLLPRLFADIRPVEIGRRRWLWAPRRLTALGADLLAVEVHPWMASWFRRAGWTIVPQTVRWRAAMTDVPPARPGKSLRANLKRVESLGHEVELVSRPTPDDLREFRVEMAQPLARERFGALAWEPSPALFRGWAKRCQLLFIRVGGRRVAGEVILRHGDEAHTPLQGVRGCDFRLLEAGVQSALYAGFFDYARRSGARSVDVGLTSSFLRDGVAYYKRQWGFSPHRDRMARLIALRVDLTHPGAASAFEREPLMTLTDTGFGRLPPEPDDRHRC